MDKKGFKIGDKVKLKPNYVRRFRQGTKIGEIISFNHLYIRVKYDGGFFGCPYKENEIDHAVKIGEQLLLFEL